MSRMKKLYKAGAAVAVAGMFALPGHAATIQYTGGQFTTFAGFDWSSNATAFTTGYDPATANDTFGITFFSYGAALQSPNTVPSGMDLIANGGGANSTGFNWTVVANLNEQVFGCLALTCAFDLLAGSTFDIYYNPTFDANHTAGSLGTGFTNGVKIISGTLTPTTLGLGGTFTTNVAGTAGQGSAALNGTITYTNSAYVAPNLLGTTVGTTLQFGTLTTQWTNPGGYNGVAWTGRPDQVVFQADANQTFTQVPEPGTVSLLALGLLGAGMANRRKREMSRERAG